MSRRDKYARNGQNPLPPDILKAAVQIGKRLNVAGRDISATSAESTTATADTKVRSCVCATANNPGPIRTERDKMKALAR